MYTLESYTIISAILNDNGELEIIKKYPSNALFSSHPSRPVPDKIIKEIYSSVDGKIVLKETIEGKHTPAYLVEEKIEF